MHWRNIDEIVLSESLEQLLTLYVVPARRIDEEGLYQRRQIAFHRLLVNLPAISGHDVGNTFCGEDIADVVCGKANAFITVCGCKSTKSFRIAFLKLTEKQKF